jgi:hypothetical protein
MRVYVCNDAIGHVGRAQAVIVAADFNRAKTLLMLALVDAGLRHQTTLTLREVDTGTEGVVLFDNGDE